MIIFIISRGYPSERDPQWGNFETDQARALAALGHCVTMLSVDVRVSKLKNRFGVTKVVEQGVTSYSLNPGAWVISSVINKSFFYWIYQYFLLKLYERIVKYEGVPDVIYAHYQTSSEAALKIKRKYDVPIVGLEHWSALGLENPPKTALEHGRKVYPALDKVLVVSKSLRESLKKFLNINSIVVNNIIGDEFYYKEHRNTDGIVHFVLTGNLKPVKCIDMAIKAFAVVAKKNRNICFTIVGDGVEKERLIHLIEKNNLADVIHLIGRKDRNYIVQLLQKSDVYILSSSSETFGVAAGEALACGVPVIATDCGGPRDFMNDFNGLLIPVNDTEAMTKAMLYMVNHYKDYDRAQIAEDCRKRFSSEAIGKQLEDIFEEVIKSNKK